MRLIPMLVHYVWWHYTTAIADLVRNYLNIVSVLTNFFSLNHLTRNLFAPWRRLGEEYPAGALDIGAFFSTLIVNTLMRLVGFMFRIILIVFGLVCLLLSLLVFVATVYVWLVMPAILIFLIVFSYRLLIV